ncbi:LuxR family transcriptional regulator [Mycobacterium yunnanensis]|uniref:LuxR family transcriptional regulator n=1 Tax=Mycobacterium yunnanensis TaxID=368477 RepID=A0A9X3BSG0_9MYCO|nr:LuxR family transcriptional regulator [Mycobacterium yunnanensis]MCV7420544.1 LuxR family transcriptional regulator [Mycobacterium yunnanensis]
MSRTWPLAGRDDLLDEVMAVLEESGVSGLALTGGAGVGKSRVAWEAAERAAARGWTVRRISATATSQHVPLGACAQWTDDVGGGEAALVRRVGEAVVAGSDVGRLLLVVDDAHLLDDLSVLVVKHLVDSGTARVVMTLRTGEPTPAALHELGKNGHVVWREVMTLSRERMDAVLAAAFGAPPDGGCSARFWTLTGGNMLFVRQLAGQEADAGRLAVADGALRWSGDVVVSGSLADLVERQVGALREPVLEVIDTIAVAEPLDRRWLSLLAEQDAVEEAEQRGLIRLAGEQVYLGHPLFAEIRRTRCGAVRLARLRGRVATAMGEGGSAAVLVKRGLLWLESDLALRPELLAAAGGAANSLLDFDLAERLFAAAAEAGVGPRAHVLRAWTLFMMGDGESADDVLSQAPRQGEVGPGFRNEVVLRASNELWAKRNPEKARQIVEHALMTETGERRAQILVFRANQLALAGRTLEVLQTLEQVDDRELDPYGTAMACIPRCMAHGDLGQLDQVATAIAVSARALEATIEGAHLHGPLTEVHASALAVSGRIGEALAVAQQFARSQYGRDTTMCYVAQQIQGMAHLAAGDLRAALEHLPAQPDPSCWSGRGFHATNSFPRFELMRAQALARVGEVDSAERALAVARECRPPAYHYYDSADLIAEAWIAAARSRFGDARALALTAADVARDHQQWAREVWCLQTAVQLDDTDAAERLTELAERVGTVRATVAAQYAEALSSDDATGLEAVSELWESMGDRLAAADAAAQSATSHRRAGRAGSATTAAGRARHLAALCGQATSPAIVTAEFSAPFTNREREIVVLVAQGLTNRQIADIQSLSVRTVESHIYRASNKAGVTGRAGLGALADT